ncbi:MAG: hypothetical protein QME66_04120 [Candidatus Eisenbacteria bacterium]|nr:hypothetical protein [Candidatus Eisenbacteria bacterium]
MVRFLGYSSRWKASVPVTGEFALSEAEGRVCELERACRDGSRIYARSGNAHFSPVTGAVRLEGKDISKRD